MFVYMWNKIKSPKVWVAIMHTIASIVVIVATILLLCFSFSNYWFTYILYGLSAIFLTYEIYIIIYYAPRIKQYLINNLRKSKLFAEMLDSYGYRSFAFASLSFIFNVIFALFYAVMAIVAKSIWLGALATYYIAVSLIKGGIIAVSRKRNNEKKIYTEQKQVLAYRNCGIYIVLLNFAFMGAIIQMAVAGGAFQYAGFMIYAIAAYTFYKLTMAIYNIIKVHKQNDYTLQSIKNLSLVESLVSLLALQSALLYAFAGNYSPVLPNSLVGAAVSIVTILIGVFMIIRGEKQLKNLRIALNEK